MTAAGGGAPFAFVGATPVVAALDRADPLRADAAALASLWHRARVLVIDEAGRALAGDGGGPLPLSGAGLDAGHDVALFLGLGAEGTAWFAVDAADVPSLDGHPHRADLRAAAATWPALEAAAFAAGRATLHWRRRHRHCGGCGGTLAFSRGGWLGHCDGCGIDHYPRTDPAIIVAVGDGDRLLLGRQATWPAGRWSVIAGFVEPGETLEQTVVREVFEETGVRVRACRYLASQPWPFPGALMLGFVGEAEPDSAACAGEELEDARWFEQAEIEAALAAEARGVPEEGPFLLPSRISIAHWLVREWLATRTG
jgi:NAD+ diphosphatase